MLLTLLLVAVMAASQPRNTRAKGGWGVSGTEAQLDTFRVISESHFEYSEKSGHALCLTAFKKKHHPNSRGNCTFLGGILPSAPIHFQP